MPILGSPPPSVLLDHTTYPPGRRFGPTQVQIGDITWGMSDADATEWHYDKLDGWDDTPEVVSQKTERVGQHGVHLGPQTYAARTLTLNGWICSRTMALRETALKQLHRSLPVNALAVVRVSDPPERYVQARIDGQIKATRIGQHCFAIQIPLIAPDPRKYGLNPDPLEIGLPQASGGVDLPTSLPVTLPVRLSGGSSEATSQGDMPAPWIARFIGPVGVPGIEVPDLGRRFAVNVSLGAGETLDLDSRTQTVVLNGTASRSGLIVRGSSWFELPPESTTTVRFTAGSSIEGSTPAMSFTPLSAWS